MKYEIYLNLTFTPDYSVIDFISIGKHGAIPKRIVFTETELQNVYNLAFGDIDENGDIDDCRISDNGDRNKILATVVKVVDSYTQRYPYRWIIFSGSTKERTRLYRIAIGINLEELSKKYEIYAFVQDELKPFIKNMEINSFVIKRKND
jgi:hypothetical protein